MKFFMIVFATLATTALFLLVITLSPKQGRRRPKLNITTPLLSFSESLVSTSRSTSSYSYSSTTETATARTSTNLPLSDINIIILTDVHSWVGGHGSHSKKYDADYGNVVSFYENLKKICIQEGRELFFVMNGDFVDGTGLTTIPPIYLTSILKQMPWDALNIGNHELYKNSTIQLITGYDDDKDKDTDENTDKENNGDTDGTGAHSGTTITDSPVTNTGTITDSDGNNDQGADGEQKDGDELDGGKDPKNTNSTTDDGEKEDDDDSFVKYWNGTYLTTNTILKETNDTIGERYTFLKGPVQNTTLLTFGFLYNFQSNCEITTVETVESVVNQTWFKNVLLGNEGDFDAIVVLAHMDVKDPLVLVILDKIREICGEEIIVQFVTGHTHQRLYAKLDNYSTSFEADKYLETVGFVSFALNKTNNQVAVDSGVMNNDVETDVDTDNANSFENENDRNETKRDAYSPNFSHEFIDANVAKFKELLGIQYTETAAGRKLSNSIRQTQEALGLLRRLGCAPEKYDLETGMDKQGSLWGLFSNQIIPQQLLSKSKSKSVFIQSRGPLRFSLFPGNVTLDDLISVTPFNDTIYSIPGIRGKDFHAAFGPINFVEEKNSNSYMGELPKMVVSGNIQDDDELYIVYTVHFNLGTILSQLQKVTDEDLEPTALKDMSTFDLWNDFIETNWECEKQDEEEDIKTSWEKFKDFFESFTVVKTISFILTFIVMIFFGWMFLCRNHRPKHNTTAMEDNLSYFDDSVVEMSDDSDISVDLNNHSLRSPNTRTSYSSIARDVDDYGIV